MERQDVTVIDIPSALLQAVMDDEMFMALEGKYMDLMVLTATEIYQKYVTIGNNDNPVLYVKLWKAH